MKMAIYVAVMFVVGILGTEKGRTYGTCEMLYVILLVACGYITASQSHSTFAADEI